MWLEQPVKTLTTAGLALLVGAIIIVAGLNGLNWAFG